MLIKCPECELQVSDKALNCPHCGYPLKKQPPSQRVSKKHRRLPNGFGQISKITGNLRKPYRAMVTIGKTDEGKPICNLLQPEAYFETYNDAYQALLEYNRNPYTFSSMITVEELYDKWMKANESNISAVRRNQMRSAWNYCGLVKNIKVLELRPRHIRQCIEEGTAVVHGTKRHTTPAIQTLIKVMFNKMLDYAVEYELIDKNYARTFAAPRNIQKEAEENCKNHIPYTDEEISILWSNTNYQDVDMILIQCYTGLRPKELELMETANINLDQGIMIGGVKTKAGKDRIIPIHPKIAKFIQKYYERAVNLDSKYLFMVESGFHKVKRDYMPFNYLKYKYSLSKIVQDLGLNPEHRPHDGRAHFITMAKKYQMDEYAIKRIVGHAINDITEEVYTQRTIDWLKTKIEKIK